jgi:hypothetical protein
MKREKAMFDFHISLYNHPEFFTNVARASNSMAVR